MSRQLNNELTGDMLNPHIPKYSPGYIEFYTKHLDIFDKIYTILKNYNKYHDFSKNILCLHESVIYNKLIDNDYINHDDIEYIKTVLIIWTQNHCTFYARYGRIIYNNVNNNIYYLDKSYNNSCLSNPLKTL